MSNSIFLFDNLADYGLITASTEVLPVENVINTQRSKVWRSGVGTTSSLTLILPELFSITHIAFVDTNLSTGGIIDIEGWSDALDGMVKVVDESISPNLYVVNSNSTESYGAGPYGLGAYGSSASLLQNGTRNITILTLPSPELCQYFRITFTDAATAYQQLGRLFVGNGLSYAYNLSYGWSAERVERTVARESLGGQRFIQPRDSRLRLSGSFEHLTESERTDTLIRIQQYGQNRPFIYSIFPENTSRGLTTTVYGRFESAQLANPFYNTTNYQFSVIEEL